MKDHIIHGSIAALVAGGIVTAMPPKQIVTQVTHSISASKHAWPDLNDMQKADLAEGLKRIAARDGLLKIEIMCNDGACTDLAQDIDDAAEAAGIDSVLDRAVLPLGYGLGVMAEKDDPRARLVADLISQVTGHKEIEIRSGNTASSGYPVWIGIGKLKR